MSLQHIQKNSPRLLPKPAKFEKNPPNGYRVIRKTKCGAGGAGGAAGAGGAGGAGSSPIHKQASLAGRLTINNYYNKQLISTFMFGNPRLPLKERPKVKLDHTKRFPALNFYMLVYHPEPLGPIINKL